MKFSLLIILCSYCFISTSLFSAENQVMVATWELKQQVRQLRQDISTQQGGLSRLLDRCSLLLQEHPDHLVQQGQQFIPIQDILMTDLRTQGLHNAWVEHVDAFANELLGAAQQQEATLRSIAQRFPETNAAQKAWQQLADMAWDHGHLGSYLFYALRANKLKPTDQVDTRLEAAQSLLNTVQHGNIPQNLERVDSIWEEELPVIQTRNLQRNTGSSFVVRSNQNNRNQQTTPYQVSHGNSNVLVLSNGINMLILDPLLGRRLGPIHNLGHNNFGTQSNRAFVSDDLIVAIGGDRNGLSVIACDHLGQQRWRKILHNSAVVIAASRPIILDNSIFLCVIENNNSSERIKLICLDLKGNEQWRKVVAQVTGARNQYQRTPQDLSPDICIHRGRIAVLSNRGVIAQVSSNGSTMSLDSYPVSNVDMRFIRQMQARENKHGVSRLAGRIRSDGQYLVATPIDSNVILTRDGEDTAFQIYKGDGQGAMLLDVQNSNCLVLDDKIRLLDLKQQSMIWEQELDAQGPSTPWGRIGHKRCLVAINQRISTHSISDGELIAEIKSPDQQRVVMHNDLMLFIGDRTVTGRGDSLAFEESLMTAANSAPNDPQPRIALSALRRAQGKSMEAFNYLLTAIELGAAASYSENAAQILRPHLYLTLNNEQFTNYLQQLERLLAIDPRFDQELDWWRARRAEYQNDTATALKFYKSMQRTQPRYITLSNRLQANLNTIAQASILRLTGKDAPWISKAPYTQKQQFADWHVEGSSPITPLAADIYIVAFINGFLRCYDAVTGKELWKQNTENALPMLGVSTSPGNQQQNNARVVVLKGMTADIIGMQHNDVITKFNDSTINNWPDIIKAVSDIGCGQAFSITVQRGEAEHTFKGVLGAKPMQATQANKKSVLCRNVLIRQDPRRPGHFTPSPDSVNTPFVDIYDLPTGTLLWHHTLDAKAFMPILTGNDLLLESRDGDLIAHDVRAEGHPIVWTAKGRGHELSNHSLHGDVLISIDHNTSHAHIRNMSSGDLLFSIPCNPMYETKLLGDQFACTLPDGHLALWQLSTGDMLWSSQEALLKPLAASETAIYCRTARDELISIDRTNGLPHRRYPRWTQVFAHNNNDSTLFLACVNQQQDQTIASVHLKSGNVTWEHPFSSDLQFNSVIIPNRIGAHFRLSSDDERHGFVHVLNDGLIHSFIPVDMQDGFSPIGQQLVTCGINGLQVTQAEKDSKERVFPIKRLQKEPSEAYDVFIGKQLKKLKWTSLADNEFAIMRIQDRLHVICKFQDDNQRMRLRLGHAGSLFDTNSALVLLKSMFEVNLHVESGWQLIEQCELQGANEQRIRAFSVQVPPLQTPATPILIHVDHFESTGNDIWWLRKYWWRLQE